MELMLDMKNNFVQKTAFVLFFSLFVSVSVLAQHSGNNSTSLEKGENEFGVWGGGAVNNATLFGSATDRKLVIAGVRYGRVVGTTGSIAWEYTFDLVPIAKIYQPDSVTQANPRAASSIYGKGLSPFGLKLNFNRHGRLKPFVSASGGFLYFNRGTPVEVLGATRFNFTFDFGGGVQVFSTARSAVSFGYKLHHISNARITSVNPGLDSNVFYAGFSIFR